MVRKQMYFPEDLDRRLALRARQLGVSQAELVRVALDTLLESDQASAKDRALEGLRQGWDESVRQGIGRYGASWTREELHERSGTKGAR